MHYPIAQETDASNVDRWTWKLRSLLLPLFIVLTGCNSLIAPYNETAYQNATSVKAQAMLLITKATEPYADHEAEVDELMLKVEQAYEYAKGIPNNENSTNQWELLKAPDGNLLGGFMNRWKNDGSLGRAFVDNARDDLVGPALDEIIRLESEKIRTRR